MMRCYKKGDIDRIKLQPEQEVERNEDWRLFENINTITFADGDEVLAIVYPHEQYGNITIYALISSNCGYKAVSMVKEFKRWIKEQIKRDDVCRICFTTQSRFEQANRLALLLGFEYEGYLHRWFKGIDFNMWGIWK